MGGGWQGNLVTVTGHHEALDATGVTDRPLAIRQFVVKTFRIAGLKVRQEVP